MRKLCPNFDREDGLDTVLEIPIPEEMFPPTKNKWTHFKSWLKLNPLRSPITISSSIRNSQIQLLLGVIAAPLIPLPIPSHHTHTKSFVEQPIDSSMAKYIIHQYIAAAGGDHALNSIDSMYAIGKVKMSASEFTAGKEFSGNKQKGKKHCGEVGGFVLWSKKPDLWCLELVGSCFKISAGSNGKVTWRQTPWHSSHASRGPPRPLRRSLQALNLILLTSYELSELRELLKKSLADNAGKDLFHALYSSWCHSPMAIISLCLLAQAYQHASTVIQSLVEEDTNVKFLVQLDKLVRLLETPTFAYLRLQLLEPARYTWLLKSLYGLLMLLPQQSAAFKILRTRLKTVPSYSFSGDQVQNGAHSRSSNHMDGRRRSIEDGDMSKEVLNEQNGINFALRLQQFENMQRRHRQCANSQARSRKTSASLTKEIPRPEENQQEPSIPDTNQLPRSSRRTSGQSQL